MGKLDDLEQGDGNRSAGGTGLLDQLEQRDAAGAGGIPHPNPVDNPPAATLADNSAQPQLPPLQVTTPSLAPQQPGPIQQLTQPNNFPPAPAYAQPPQDMNPAMQQMPQQMPQALPPQVSRAQPQTPPLVEQRDEAATALADQFIQRFRQQTGSGGLPPEMQTRIFVQQQLNQLGLGRNVVPDAVHLPQYGPEDDKIAQTGGMGMRGDQSVPENMLTNIGANAQNAVGQAGGVLKAKANAIVGAMAPMGAADVIEQQNRAGLPASDFNELTAGIQKDARQGVREGNAQAAANPTDNPGIGFIARNAPAVAGNVAAATALGPVAGPVAFNAADMGAGMYAKVYDVIYAKAKGVGYTDEQADDVADKAASSAGKLGAGLGAVLGLPLGQALKKFGLGQAVESEAAKAVAERPVIGAMSEQAVKDVAAKAALKQVGEAGIHAGIAAGIGGVGAEGISSVATGDKFDASKAAEGTGEQLLVGMFSGAVHAMVSDYTGATSEQAKTALENAVVDHKFGKDITPEQRAAAIKALRTYRDVVAEQKDFSTAAKDNGLTSQDVEAVRNMQGGKSDPTTEQQPPNSPEGGDSHEERQGQEGRQEVLAAPETPAAEEAPAAGEPAAPVKTWSDTPGDAVNQLVQRAGDRGVTITGKQAVRTVGAIASAGGDFQAEMDKALDAVAPPGAKDGKDIAGAFATLKNAGKDGFIDSMWRRVQSGEAIDRMGGSEPENTLREAQKAGTLKSRQDVADIVNGKKSDSPKTPAALPQDVTQADYDKAVAAVKERGSVSVSHVQRVLMTGYKKATAIIAKMEADGIAGPFVGPGKPRELLQQSTTPPAAQPSAPPANPAPSAQVVQADTAERTRVNAFAPGDVIKGSWGYGNDRQLHAEHQQIVSHSRGMTKLMDTRTGEVHTTNSDNNYADLVTPAREVVRNFDSPSTRKSWLNANKPHILSSSTADSSRPEGGTNYRARAILKHNAPDFPPDHGPQPTASPTPAAPTPPAQPSAGSAPAAQGAQTSAGEGSAASEGPGTSAREEPSPASGKTYGKSNKVVTESRYEELKRKWQEAMKRTLSGFDPELMSMAAQMAAYHLEAGARQFTDFVKAMVSDLGESIKPYLKSAYIAAKHMPGMEEAAKQMNSAHYVEGLEQPDVDAMIGENHARGSEQTESPVVRAGVPAAGPTAARPVLGVQDRAGDEASGGGATQGGGSLPAGGGGEAGAGDGQVRQSGGAGSGPDGSQAAGDGGDNLPGAAGGGDTGAGDGRGSRGGQPGRGDVANAEQQQQRDATPALSSDFTYIPEAIEEIQTGGLKTKYARNVEAIRTLRIIEGANRPASAAEQEILAKWTGFGAMPGAVNPDAESAGDWADERNEIADLLTPEELAPLRKSTLNAHYTAPTMVTAMWDILQRMGFDGGRVLEPSLGIGYFLGLMPEDLRGTVKATGIELDSLTGRMAKLLYPNSNIQVKGFEETAHPDNFFDVAIGNVPFGSYRVHDPAYNKYVANIHDYFFLKSLDKVRPGGIVAFITSTGTMDKIEPRIRAALATKADLVWGARFPEGAHQKNAGTAVVTDMLFFKKRAPDAAAAGHAFQDIHQVPDPAHGEPIPINQYFANNPQQVLGKVDRKSRMYGPLQPHVSMTPDFPIRFLQAMAGAPTGIYEKAAPKRVKDGPRAAEATKDGSIVLQDGKLYRKNGELLEEHPAAAKNVPIIKGMIGVRDALRKVFAAQLSGASQDAVSKARQDLNKLYDAFVAKHGALNSFNNAKMLAGDPDQPLLLAAEHWDRQTQKAEKADVFHKNTIRPVITTDKADTTQDAVRISNNELGRVDVPRVAKLMGISEEEAAAKLVESGAAYLDPAHGWQSAENYLSGNVRQKLKAARDAASSDPKFQPNVDALEKVQPEDVPHDLIDAHLGQPWIPNADVQQFAADIMGGIPEHFRVTYSPANSEYLFDYTRTGEGRHLGRPQDIQTWGTKRKSFPYIMEAALNGKRLTLKDKVGDESVVNNEETAAANQKVDELQAKFSEWLWEDGDRRRRLHRFYNDTFNNIVPTQFDGSHLSFPGMVNEMYGEPFAMRDHQKNAVWRTINNGADLYAHEVGTGKTYTMGAAAMELRRLGLANKPCIACLKANMQDVADDLKRLYPTARILVADSFDGDNRRRAVSQIATGDWDAVVMTHDQLGKLPMSKETQKKHLSAELQQLEDIVLQANDEAKRRGEGKGNKITKQLEASRARLQEKIEKAMSAATDDAVTFEETGIDHLFVDEAHKFKSLPVYTKHNRVKGIPSTTSDRAQMMLMRTRWLMENNNGRGVTFATGTPIANTVAELFNLQRYLQPKALEERGISAFDAWGATFGRMITREEYNVQGGVQPTTRFAAFTNLPELRQMISSVVDIKRAKDIPGLVRPKRKDEVVAVPMTDEQRAYLKDIEERAAAIKGQPPVPGGDNMLSISMDARKSAMHMRMVDAHAEQDDGKIERMVDSVLDISKKNPGKTQMIFSDLGVNKLDTGFHLYQYIIDKLVAGGIPADKIIDFTKFKTSDKGEVEKEKNIERLRTGDALIGIGGSETMGTGVNAQDHLLALHHIDVPWIPAFIEQRDGRGVRQGNLNALIRIIRYVTEGSFDKFMWQTVDAKHNFITQFMDGDYKERTMRNGDEGTLSPAQVMALASGDPHQLEKVNLEKDIKELEAGARRHSRGEIGNRDLIKQLEEKIADIDKGRPIMEAVYKQLEEHDKKPFSMTLGGQTFDKVDPAQNALDAIIENKKERFERDGVIGEHRGYPLEYSRTGGYGMGFSDRVLIDRGPAGKHDASANIESIIQTNSHHRYGQKLNNLTRQRERHVKDIAKLKENAGRPYIKAEELKTKQEKLANLYEKMAAERNPQETPEQAKARRNARKGFVDLKPLFDAVDKVMEKLRRLAGWVKDLPHTIADSWNGMAGHSAPKITKANRAAGEAMVRWASSRIASPLIARMLSAEVLGSRFGDADFTRRLGGVLTEDNLRGIKQGFIDAGDTENASNVNSIVGADDSPFADESEYQDALDNPDIKEAIEKHKAIVMPYAEELYKTASDIAPDEELPPRGKDTQAFINLKALRDDEEEGEVRPVGTRRGNVANTFTRKSKFNTQAYGSADRYDIDYNNIVNNSIVSQLELANQKTAYDALAKANLAKIDKSGANVEFDGERAVAFPIRRTTVVIPKGDQTKAFAQQRNIFVRPELASEFRAVADTDEKATLPPLTWAAGVANSAALAGVTEAVVHTTNLMSALQGTPLVTDRRVLKQLEKAGGLGKLAAAVTEASAKWQALSDDSPEMREGLASLAEIGALRPHHPDAGKAGDLLHKLDTSVRLVLNDVFDRLVGLSNGGVQDNETNRREFINRVGQYNHRLQGPLLRILRATGIGPFSTAGYTFLREGWRRATLSSGIKEADSKTRNKLRVLQTSALLGSLLFTPAIFNYAMTGHVFGRPGTPFGAVDTGVDTKDGRPLVVDTAKIFGLRRALSVTGVGSWVDMTRAGKTTAQKMDAVGEDMANSVLSPAFGPLVRAATTLTTGYAPRIGSHRRAAKADVGDSQLANNAKEAAAEFNPLTGEGIHAATDKDWTPGEAAGRMSGGLVRPGGDPNLAEQDTFSSLMHDIYVSDLPQGRMDDAERKKWEVERKIIDGLRNKSASAAHDLAAAASAGQVNRKEARSLVKTAAYPIYVRWSKQMSAKELLRAWQQGGPDEEEKKFMRPILAGKIWGSGWTPEQKTAAYKIIGILK